MAPPARAVRCPLGLANFKMIPVSLLPLGCEIVPTDQAGAVLAGARF